MLSEQAKNEIRALGAAYPDRRSAVLPACYVAQGEIGYLPDEALGEVANLLGLPALDVAAATSFYTMFYRTPVGKHILRVCTNLSCQLLGADSIAGYLGKKLGIAPGQTTADGCFSLETVECIGGCDVAPAMLVDDKLLGPMTPEKIDALLAELGRASTTGDHTECWTKP